MCQLTVHSATQQNYSAPEVVVDILGFKIGGSLTHRKLHRLDPFSIETGPTTMAAQDIIDNSPHHPDPSPPVPWASNLVLLDNYDSFTYNVYQYLVLEGATVTVYRNDQVTLDELIAQKPTQLVVSPGPGHPQTDSGISRDAIRHFAGKIPIFGVCMGQ